MTSIKVSELSTAVTPYDGSEYSLGIQDSRSVKIPVPNLAGSLGATLIGITPSGTISANTVASALNELDTEKATVSSVALKINIADLAATTGTNLVGHIRNATGAIATTSQKKHRESMSVADFGADPTGVSNSYAAFAAAIAASPSTGGKILVGDGNYLIDGDINVLYHGLKSIFWDISPSATFTGTGTGYYNFPTMQSNGGQLAVGPYIYSCSLEPSPYNGTIYGGIASLSVEMIQNQSYVGQSVGIYGGVKGSSPDPSSNVWASNLVMTAMPGAGGIYQGIEMDVNCYSSTATVRGIVITGTGDSNPDSGLYISRSPVNTTVDWDFGIVIRNSSVGILMDGGRLTRGISIGPSPAVIGSAITAKQLQNNQDTIYLERNTETSPTGYFIRCAQVGNTANLFSINAAGALVASNIDTAGHCIGASYIQGGNIRATTSAGTSGTTLSIGNSTAITVGAAGGASALPATPLGYLIAYLGATSIKIPYYTA